MNDEHDLDVTQSPEYRALAAQFADYRARQEAKADPCYAQVKPKFFDAVYDMVEKGDGAESPQKQIARIRQEYGEFFVADEQPRLMFSAPAAGSMPTGGEGAEDAILKAWGFEQ